jgi:hypothetical protein
MACGTNNPWPALISEKDCFFEHFSTPAAPQLRMDAFVRVPSPAALPESIAFHCWKFLKPVKRRFRDKEQATVPAAAAT